VVTTRRDSVDEIRVRELVARVVDRALVDVAETRNGDGDAIAVGCDHGGYRLKEALKAHLEGGGRHVRDCGTSSTEAVDYPDFALAVAELVSSGACRAGIVVDGAGIGSAMVANKVPGVRAALCYDLSSARNSREHNHANVLTLGAGLIGEALAKQIVDEWLATDWGPGRHAARVAKITAVEARYAVRRPAGSGG
jgi:RpiB/LacA/LacB family sugar-phosphate isomerase